MKPTIVIADDHPILLMGNKHYLESKGFHGIFTATNGNEAYNEILNCKPDIAILDFDMPIMNGLEVAEVCRQKELGTKIIILTLYKQELILKEVGKNIQGYILKEEAVNEIETCIQKVLSGKTYISKGLTDQIHFSNTTHQLEVLTAAEAKVLRYLAKNLSSAQIAEALFISKRTVEKHRSNIIKKMKIPSTQNGLLLWVQKNPKLFNM